MSDFFLRAFIIVIAIVSLLIIYVSLKSYFHEVSRCKKCGARVLVRISLRSTFYVSTKVYQVDSLLFSGHTEAQGNTISVRILGCSPESVMFPDKEYVPVIVIEDRLATPDDYLLSYMASAYKSDFV